MNSLDAAKMLAKATWKARPRQKIRIVPDDDEVSLLAWLKWQAAKVGLVR